MTKMIVGIIWFLILTTIGIAFSFWISMTEDRRMDFLNRRTSLSSHRKNFIMRWTDSIHRSILKVPIIGKFILPPIEVMPAA